MSGGGTDDLAGLLRTMNRRIVRNNTGRLDLLTDAENPPTIEVWEYADLPDDMPNQTQAYVSSEDRWYVWSEVGVMEGGNWTLMP